MKFEDHFTGVNPACPVAPEDGTGVKEKKPLAERTIQDVLLHFGDTIKVSRIRYRQFIKKGIDHGTRPELQGLLGRKKEEREKGDERILGSGDFACPVKCLCLSI